jgi:hypothetical protein
MIDSRKAGMILTFLTISLGCSAKPMGEYQKVLAQFLKSETNQAREALVTPADVQAGSLKTYMHEGPYDFVKLRDLGEVQDGKAKLIRVVFKIAKVNGEDREEGQTVFVDKTSDGPRVDLAATLALGDMTWDALRAQHADTPIKMRMEVALTDKVVTGFNDYPQGTYYGLQPSTGSDAFRSQLVFLVPKSASAASKVFDVLKDGKLHLLIVKLKGPRQDTFFKKECEITDVVQEGWVE